MTTVSIFIYLRFCKPYMFVAGNFQLMFLYLILLDVYMLHPFGTAL